MQTEPIRRSAVLAYGLPGLPLALLSLPLVIYLPAYYTEQLGLPLLALAAAVFVSRMFDILSDPLIGLLSDRMRQRGLPRRLFLIAGTPLLAFAIQRLFVAPAEAGAMYLFVWNLLAYLGWTLLYVPYLAWGAELSSAHHVRTRLAGSREGFAILGIFAAIALPTLLGIADRPGAVLAAAAQAAWILLPLTVLLAVLLAPETRHGTPPPPVAARPTWSSLLELPSLRRLIAAYVLSSAANALPASLFVFYVSQVLQAEASTGLFLAVYFITGVAALPAWVALSRRLGKARTWMLSMLLACAAFVWAPWLEAGDELPFTLICLVTGIALGADMALPASLQADLVDSDAAVAGRRRAGLMFGLWGLATKLAAAVGIGLAFLALSLAGFDPAGDNGAATLHGLALLYGLAPVLLKLTSVAMIRNFTETTRAGRRPTPPATGLEEAAHVPASHIRRSGRFTHRLYHDAP
ncbi:MAG: MFS transporter [Gammaproteobacteria bacterium]|jgi:Na+/melibiose symporter-like transporter